MRANAFYKTRMGPPPTYSLRNFFLRMGLRNCASMAGFPKMEVNFHNFFRGFHSRMSWIWVKSLCKPYQTLPSSSVHYRVQHFLPLGPGSPVSPALLGTGDPGPRGIYIKVEPDRGTILQRNGSTR